MTDDTSDFEEIEVHRIPEPDEDDGVSDPEPDEDDGYAEGVDA